MAIYHLEAKDSRLARKFEVALLTEYIQSNFVTEGMCADVAILDTDGHNPHAHIMLTVRQKTEQQEER